MSTRIPCVYAAASPNEVNRFRVREQNNNCIIIIIEVISSARREENDSFSFAAFRSTRSPQQPPSVEARARRHPNDTCTTERSRAAGKLSPEELIKTCNQFSGQTMLSLLGARRQSRRNVTLPSQLNGRFHFCSSRRFHRPTNNDKCLLNSFHCSIAAARLSLTRCPFGEYFYLRISPKHFRL